MFSRKVEVLLLCLISLAALQVLPQSAVLAAPSNKVPASIYQGPWGTSPSSNGDPSSPCVMPNCYWYQTGAMGSSSSYNYVAASVMIRTVYDQVNNDAHSYWVGGFIANGAFVQVGFLNEVSTTNQPFCCAWFYEYFYPLSAPSPLNKCCPPIIGGEGSAGPMGAWHNYTMTSNGGGTWSFYMDGQRLGTTPDLGGTAAANSGTNAPAALTEVAQASTNTDTIGPGEFKNLSFRTSGSSWQQVAQANSFIWYGKGTSPNHPPNPYGAREVEGVNNDFLAGSYVPPLDAPSQSPGTRLWPYLPPLSCCISLAFLDDRNTSFQPSWVSLQSTAGTIFFTGYNNQPIEDGTWNLTMVMWHSVDIALPATPFTTPGTNSQSFPTKVFSLQLHVVGLVTGLPVGGASVTTAFPDTASEAVTTDGSGNAVLVQLPASVYVLRFSIPLGIPAIQTQNVTGSTALTARVFASLEVALIAGLPISGAIIVLVVAVSRERRRKAMMPAIPPSFAVAGNCVTCGQPLHPGHLYCTNCGAFVQRTPT